MVLLSEPVQHVAVGHTKGIVRAAVELGLAADGNDVLTVDQPRDRKLLALANFHRELYVERGFNPGPETFAISLQSVTITQVEVRSLVIDRKQKRGALGHIVIIHVAAVTAGRSGAQ